MHKNIWENKKINKISQNSIYRCRYKGNVMVEILGSPTGNTFVVSLV